MSLMGHLFIIAAPSGAGKTSLVKALMEREPQLKTSVSYTTRAPRPGEIHGLHYHFVDTEAFLKLKDQGEFLEWAQVFDHYYGTSQNWVKQQLEAGIDILLEIDWQGAAQVRRIFPQSVSVFILPPSRSALEQRLRLRQQDSDAVIARRMASATAEISHYQEFDFLIVNENFATALQDLHCLVRAQYLKLAYQQPRLTNLIASLLKSD